MFKHYFESIEGIAIWPVLSMLIFITFFIGLGFWLTGVDKKYIRKMKNLPLEEDSKKEVK